MLRAANRKLIPRTAPNSPSPCIMCVYTRFQSLNRFSAKFIHSSWRNSAYGSAARAEQEDERGLEKPQAAPPQAASRPGFQSFRPNANPSIPQQSQWSNQVGPRGNAPKNQSEWRAPDRPIGGGAVGYPGPSSSSVSTFQRSSQGGGISSPIPPAPGPTTRPTGPLPAGYQPGYQPGFQRPPPGYPPLRPPQNFTGPAQSSYHKNNTSSTPAPFPGQSTSPLGSGQLGYQPGYQRMPLPPNGAPPNGASPNGAPSRPLQNLPGPVPPGNQPYQKNNMPPPFPAPTQSNYSSTHPSYQRQPPPPVDFPSRLPQGNSGHTQQPYQPGYQRQPLPPGGASPRSGQNPTEPSPLGYRSGYLGQPIPPNGASPRLGQNSSGPAPPGYQPRYQGQPIPPNGAFPRLGQNSSGPAPPGYQPGLQGQPIPPNGAPPRLGQKLAGPAPLGSQGNSTSPPFPNITQGSYGSTQSGYQPGYQRQQLPSRPPQNYSGPTQSGNQQPGYQGSGISSNTSQFSSQGHDPFGSRYERAQLPSTSERRQASGYQPQFNPLGTTVSTPGQFHGILDELVEGKSLLRRNDMNRQDTLPQWDRRSTGGTQGNLQGQNGQFVQSGQHGAQQEQMQAEPARETRRAKPEVELDKAGKKKNKDRGKRGFGAAESWILDEDEAATKEAKRLKKLQKKEKPIPLYLPEFISVANLAKTVKQPLDAFMEKLTELGYEGLTYDYVLNAENAGLIAMEYNYDPIVDTSQAEDLLPRPPPADKSVLPPRPPVVTIMGHVDHGKTTLLDWLRKSSIAASEHGGITQHIGAFSVSMPSGKNITFLDTPGHAAFLSMRERGANATDIVILVVAADDSVKPQTLEALKHATAAKVPIIVAVSKSDKPDADLRRVKEDLGRHNVEIEEIGGDTQVIPVSGKTGLGMGDLEEAIVTLAEVLDMRAEVDGPCEGWVLEATTKKRGRVATILVRRGTLRPGDIIVAGHTWARVKTLINESGVDIQEAPPGTPVEVDGWKDQPEAGDLAIQTSYEDHAKSVVAFRKTKAERLRQAADMEAINEQKKVQREVKAQEKHAAENPDEVPEAPITDEKSKCKEIAFIVKADVSGSAEAVVNAISALGNGEVRAKIIRSSFGPVTEFDIDHAAAAQGYVLAFNLSPEAEITKYAAKKGVKIINSSIIYEMLDTVSATLSEYLPPKITYPVTGEAEVLAIFNYNIRGRVLKPVAGCRVTQGTMKKNSRARLLRKGEILFDGTLSSLKNVKKDVSEMAKGKECGVGFEDWDDFEIGDHIQCYEEVKQKRSLPAVQYGG